MCRDTLEPGAEKEPKINEKELVEIFFYLKFFLEMAIKYGNELQEPPEILPYGYAAVLYLYGLR